MLPSTVKDPHDLVPGAWALLVFHSVLLAWWTFIQLYYRVLMRLFTVAPFGFGIISWCLIATALVVFARFAVGRRGTDAAVFANAVVVFALIDFIGETLQFAPQLGLPALIPSDKSTTELVVRAVWVSCEFSLRICMFSALWRAQAGCKKIVRYAFLGLVLTQWGGTLISFIPGNGAGTAWWTTQPVASLLVRVSAGLAVIWLALMVWVNLRVVRGQRPLAA